MLISFQGPEFFSQPDEDQFFRWLASLPEYKDVRGVGTAVELSLTAPVQAETVMLLLVIFHRWHVDVKPLLVLRSPETDGFVLWDTALGEASISGA